MARTSRRWQALAVLALATAAHATTLTDLPTITSTSTDASSATSATSATTTDASSTTDTSSGASTATTASSTDSSATTSGASSSSSSTSIYHLSDVPTIAGASIPTLVIPYTADAPFMQKSNLPEGTVFIAVGAVLAFFGACVLLWRGLVAWSINRSVKKAALVSIRGSEKDGSTWGGGSGYHPPRGNLYKDQYNGSAMSLDALTSTGRHASRSHFKEFDSKRDSTPPAGLFFSPTAQAGSHNSVSGSRNPSAYLPAGYYASPNAQAAGGAPTVTVGGTLSSYARHASGANPSPPPSPGLPPSSRSTAATGYRASSRDGLRAPTSRDGYGSRPGSYYDSGNRSARNSAMYAAPSSSSLMVGLGGSTLGGTSSENLGGSRAPSAYLEDLFENHGNGPRERY